MNRDDGQAGSTLPALLGVSDVLERYGLRDPRAARKIMNAAGGFKVAAHLYVRADSLSAYEDALAGTSPTPIPRTQPTARPSAVLPRATRNSRDEREPLRPGWWRAPNPDGSLDVPTNRR